MKNKTRKLLGRFTAALIVIVLVISVFSCAKAPTEDGATVDSLKTENNIPPENNTEKTGEKTDSSIENATDLDPVTVVNNDKLLQTDVQQEYKPLEFELDDEFSPYDVVVTLTEEESAKGKDYKVEDFAEYDIFHVFEYSEYYSKEYYPQLEKNRTFVLMLSEPSKARVLEYCEKLEKDSRVQFARPNINQYVSHEMFLLTLKEDIKTIDAEDFSNVDLKYIYSPSSNEANGPSSSLPNYSLTVGSNRKIYLILNKNQDEQKIDKEYLKKQIELIAGNEKVESLRPPYDFIDESEVTLYPVEKTEFTAEDFSPILIGEIKTDYESRKLNVNISLQIKDKKNILDLYEILNKRTDLQLFADKGAREAFKENFTTQNNAGEDYPIK